MLRCPSSTRCRAAAWPPRKLVDPTLTMSGEGTFIGSITTSGSRSRASAAISSRPSSSVTAITARRPLTARLRAQVTASTFAELLVVDRLHPDRHRDTELRGGGRDPLHDLGGVGTDLAAEGQLDGGVPLDGPQPAAVVVDAEHLLHPGAGRRSDVASTVEHLRDRRDRDTCGRGHRRQRRAGLCRRHLGSSCCRRLVSRVVLDPHGRVQPPIVADDAGGTGELDGDPSPVVRGGGADEELHLARLDDPVQSRVSVGGAVGVDRRRPARAEDCGSRWTRAKPISCRTGRATLATGSCR